MAKKDAVYIVRHGDTNEELRYSIRSIVRNLGDLGNIWVVGGAPFWIRERPGLNLLPTEQAEGKHTDARVKMLAALHHPDISDEFYYFNDDFFIMEPMPTVPLYNAGTLAEHIDYLNRLNDSARWARGMEITRLYLEDLGYPNPLSFEIHMPMPIQKEIMIKVLEVTETNREMPLGYKRSTYGAFAGLPSIRTVDRKVTHIHRSPYSSEVPIISTNDRTYATGHVGTLIRKGFTVPTQFEADDVPGR